MLNNKTIITICFLLNNSFAHDSLNTHNEVDTVIKNLVSSSFSDLNKRTLKIYLHKINSPQYFFESNFKVSRFLFGLRRYRIGYNPIIFDHSITKDALIGVLAHELVHTEDYENGSTIGTIIPIGIKLLRSKSKIQYERKTDLKVVIKRYEKELKAYRQWQYPLLEEKDLLTKKKEYLTPNEIDFAAYIREVCPKLLKRWLKGKVPLNLQQFEEEHNKFRDFCN